MNSYGVRCIIEFPREDINTKKFLYEERITVWNAENIDEAIDRAEEEVKEYCANQGNFKFTGLSQAFWMFDSISADGIEVFSLLRESDLEMDEYLDKFFSNGDERQRKKS